MGVLLAGLPVEVPGATVNRLCGVGMEAIASAARAIAAGDADICLAGGVESMTRAPFVLPRAAEPFAREAGVADTRLGWRLVSPLMQELYPPVTLGETAENVAERYGVGRERAGRVRAASHQRAAAARGGRFDGEIVPVGAGRRRGDRGRGHQARPDPGRAGREEARVPPDGTVTGGQLLAAERRRGRPAAGVRAGAGRPPGCSRWPGMSGTGAAGVHPDYMGIGPVPAMAKVLAGRAGRWTTLDLVEVNEAFAAQARGGGSTSSSSTRTAST